MQEQPLHMGLKFDEHGSTMGGAKSDKFGYQELETNSLSASGGGRRGKTYLGIFILGKVPVMSLQFHRNLIPLCLPTMFHERLHDPARIMFEHNFLYLPPYHTH